MLALGAVGKFDQDEMEDRNKTLAIGGWRAGVELGVPMADGHARLNDRRRTSETDQDEHGCHQRNRRSRLHGDAQRAMIGVTRQRMYVRHLNQGQQRQQRKTHQSRSPEGTWLRVATSAKIRLQSAQTTIPSYKDT